MSVLALTRSWPEDWQGHRGRVDRMLLDELAPPAERPLVYVCGPTAFVEAVAEALVGAGHDPGADQDRALRTDGSVSMEPLDGNAIAGTLYEHFGSEMTTVTGSCSHCGASGQIAELAVYVRAPGTVVRCRTCGNVVLVLTRAAEQLRVELSGYVLRAD